jgi:hypothetical protein
MEEMSLPPIGIFSWLKNNFKTNTLVLIIVTVLFTPWFWSLPIPKNLFNLDLRKDIKEAHMQVEWERGKVSPSFFDAVFLNWPTKFIQQRITIVLENLDIGNYFFSGHPRERTGVTERQKFFFFEFLLLLIGFTSPDLKKYKKFLIVYSLLVLLGIFLFKWRTFEETIVLSPLFIVIMALGLKQVLSWKKKYKILFFAFALLEIIFFLPFYFKGYLK